MVKKRTKIRYVDINVDERGFISRLAGQKTQHNFSDMELLRKVLSNEKARILYVLKRQEPRSIYHLAKILERDFKSVHEDLKLLERFGFIDFYSDSTGKRTSLIPYLTIDNLEIVVNI